MDVLEARFAAIEIAKAAAPPVAEEPAPPPATMTLCEAARTGNFGQVRAHIYWKSSVNVSDGTGMTPLHYAAEGNHGDIVRILLGSGAEVNVPGKDKMTPIYIAGINRNYDLLTLFLAHGADIDASASTGTLLQYAAKRNDLELAKFLLVNKSTVDPHALYLAAENRSIAVAELLLRNGAKVNAEDKSGATALHAAAVNGGVEIAKLLLAHGADVSAKDQDGRMPLHVVIAPYQTTNTESISVAELLIGAGADVNAKRGSGAIALHDAADNCDIEMVKFLLLHGADVHAKNSLGRTPLQVAVASSRGTTDRGIAVLEILLSRGADVNAKDERGRMSLHNVSDGSRDKEGNARALEIARMLIAKGANVNSADKSGWTPLDVAEGLDHDESLRVVHRLVRPTLAQLLRNSGAKHRSAITNP